MDRLDSGGALPAPDLSMAHASKKSPDPDESSSAYVVLQQRLENIISSVN